MLTITVNTDTGQAKPESSVTLKAGGVIPVTLNFSKSPGDDPMIEMALSPQSSPPVVLAYLDQWEKENSTTYTGLFNANDPRLINQLSGKTEQTLNCELVLTTARGRTPLPNFPIPMQSPIITGPTVSESGPNYVTENSGDNRYLKVGDSLRVGDSGDIEFFNADAEAWYRLTITGTPATISIEPIS